MPSNPTSPRKTPAARTSPAASSSASLIDAIKAELRAQGLTYAALASQLGMAESSVKRMLSKGEMTLSRVDTICQVLKLDFAELSRRVADAQPLRHQLTLAQERAIVADPKLLLMALCCLSLWSFEQIVATYRLTDSEAVRHLAHLDRIGIIELRAMNRYRLRVAKTIRWQAHGPIIDYFRRHVVQDYFSGSFEQDAELVTLVHGQITPGQAVLLNERLQRVAEDFSRQHQLDHKLPDELKRPFTLVLSMRSWWSTVLRDMRRAPPR